LEGQSVRRSGPAKGSDVEEYDHILLADVICQADFFGGRGE
jgi:hypothetical protein